MPFLRSVRLWFSLAVAVIAAAVADPLLEAASNLGIFGHGVYTDRSNLDVLPALALGLVAIAIHLGLRIGRTTNTGGHNTKERLRSWDDALRSRAVLLLPATFAAQMFVLYSMETIEQTVVFGHGLGGLVWLGAPPLIALAVHALACILIFFIATAVMHELAWATLRVVKTIRAILTHTEPAAIIVSRFCVAVRKELAPELCTAGGRAPPPLRSIALFIDIF